MIGFGLWLCAFVFFQSFKKSISQFRLLFKWLVLRSLDLWWIAFFVNFSCTKWNSWDFYWNSIVPLTLIKSMIDKVTTKESRRMNVFCIQYNIHCPGGPLCSEPCLWVCCSLGHYRSGGPPVQPKPPIYIERSYIHEG